MKDQRRKLLKALSLGGAAAATQLPAKWTKPIVESVSLPAHAQTTDPCTIQVVFRMTVAGGSGSGGFVVYDESRCYAPYDPWEGDAPFDRTFEIHLPRGSTYYFAGGGEASSEGPNSMYLEVSCCNGDDEPEITSWTIPSGSINDGMNFMIEIGPDGSCSLGGAAQIPEPPCV